MNALKSGPIQVEAITSFDGFQSKSLAMQQVYREVEDYARHGLNCILFGPRGTGKEVLAGFFAATFRRQRGDIRRPFLSINCAGLTPALALSELFGHVRGAFTDAYSEKPGLFEKAHSGVLFLDEIGDLPFEVHGHLLRALDPGEARRLGSTEVYETRDLTIICATEQPDVSIRPALLDRLGARVRVCSLDERQEDIPAAVTFFARRALARRCDLQDILIALSGQRRGTPKQEVCNCIQSDLVEQIARTLTPLCLCRRWPGNLRALRGAIDVAVIRARDLSSIEGLVADVMGHFLEQRNVHSEPLQKTLSSAPAPPVPNIHSIIPIATLDVNRLRRALPGLDAYYLAVIWEFLVQHQDQLFRRRDLQSAFSIYSKKPQARTVQSWLHKLCQPDAAGQAGILRREGNRGELYNLKLGTEEPTELESERGSFLRLPHDVIWPEDRRRDLDTIKILLDKTERVFIGGEAGVGKTLCTQALGTELSRQRAVFYYALGERGLAFFLRVLGEELESQRANQHSLAIGSLSDMHDTILGLVPHLNLIFPPQHEPILILDNVNLVNDTAGLTALCVMIQEWPLTFILVGTKLDSNLQKDETSRFVEYVLMRHMK